MPQGQNRELRGWKSAQITDMWFEGLLNVYICAKVRQQYRRMWGEGREAESNKLMIHTKLR